MDITAESSDQGSPPLARGTAESCKNIAAGAGITPACAGNRKRWALPCKNHRDHPRLRGEQNNGKQKAKDHPGSPPLARGTDSSPAIKSSFVRITPACAGNRLYHRYIPTSRGDHPRLRGEQAISSQIWSDRSGSPPLARGTVLFCDSLIFCPRITPACAGNSNAYSPEEYPAGDHPRLRGEQIDFITFSTAFLGSPPLARGTVNFGDLIEVSSRITPACAGNSSPRHR